MCRRNICATDFSMHEFGTREAAANNGRKEKHVRHIEQGKWNRTGFFFFGGGGEKGDFTLR